MMVMARYPKDLYYYYSYEEKLSRFLMPFDTVSDPDRVPCQACSWALYCGMCILLFTYVCVFTRAKRSMQCARRRYSGGRDLAYEEFLDVSAATTNRAAAIKRRGAFVACDRVAARDPCGT